jgi:predicted transport protein
MKMAEAIYIDFNVNNKNVNIEQKNKNKKKLSPLQMKRKKSEKNIIEDNVEIEMNCRMNMNIIEKHPHIRNCE